MRALLCYVGQGFPARLSGYGVQEQTATQRSCSQQYANNRVSCIQGKKEERKTAWVVITIAVLSAHRNDS